jgi:ribosomal protein L17
MDNHRNSEEIFNDTKKALTKTLNNEKLANEFIEMHKAFVAQTRRYVDKHIGLAKSANMRSNDVSKEVNQIILTLDGFNALYPQIRKLQTRLDYLETPLYKKIWNKIKCMNKILKS